MTGYDLQVLVDTLLRDPLPGMLKLCAFLLGLLTPWLMYAISGYRMSRRNWDDARRKRTRRLMLPVAWLAGLTVMECAMAGAQDVWRMNHRGELAARVQTLSFPGAAQIFSGWLVLGWLAVLIASVATRRTGLPREARTPMVRRTPARG
jgi:hypothetical protein